MTKRLRIPFIAVLLLALATVGWYQFAGQRVPPGQPPLLTLTTGSLDELKDEFNRAQDLIRIVLLLSPT